MTDARYDGSLDAPPPLRSILTCSECGEVESDPRHAEKNWLADEPGAHPFDPGDEPPPVSRPSIQPAPPPAPRKEAAMPKDSTPCSICDKPRTNHRGNVGHKFTTEVPPPAPASMVTSSDRPGMLARRSKASKRGAVARRVKRTSDQAETGDDRIPKVIEIAGRIRSLQDELQEAMTELKEMLG